MFEVTRLIHFADTADPAFREAIVAGLRADVEPHAAAVLIGPALPGGINTGDVIARFRFDTESDWRAVENIVDSWFWSPAVDHIDGVSYTGTVRPSRDGGAPTVYRLLLVAVDPATDPELVRQFETETGAMPHYIRSIGSSQLARVRDTTGSADWTHVWEQEYTSLDGLTGPYMSHPYHWAHVDRWFDPERGRKIVTSLCHGFVAIEEPFLTAR
ncbi:Dabb family protein [Prescottella agglutinans]|uniref:Dabb family protein n=1 Tax=Prescottella agglutinans TaxID=1644129 RepID=A0A438BIG7_9NOCA|nr:Dabb family protein [Prescottella agglutinans]RVW10752.1 Dabb family protein [Prescottella agglutinans]